MMFIAWLVYTLEMAKQMVAILVDKNSNDEGQVTPTHALTLQRLATGYGRHDR